MDLTLGGKFIPSIVGISNPSRCAMITCLRQNEVRLALEAIGPRRDFKVSLSGYGTHRGSPTRLVVEEK